MYTTLCLTTDTHFENSRLYELHSVYTVAHIEFVNGQTHHLNEFGKPERI